MTKGLLESGAPAPPTHEELEEQIETLRLQVRGLKEELRDKEDEIKAAKQQSAAAVKALGIVQEVFGAQHRALQVVFGELDAAGIHGGDPLPGDLRETGASGDPGAAVHRHFAYWKAWMDKFGGKTAEFIKVLLEHGRLNRNQLREATKSGWSTTDATIGKLRDLGLIEKKDSYWVLKEKS